MIAAFDEAGADREGGPGRGGPGGESARDSESAPRPWDRRPDETPAAFRAFTAYVEMGPSRSLDAVGRQLYGSGRKRDATGRLQEWSMKNDWVARAAAYDAHQDRLRSEARDRAVSESAAEWAR